jgi:tRNA pseudouridine55 synthase
LNGLLVIDKPSGMTSHDVVDVVRHRFGTRKVGHAGTLDPPATGVLLVGLGKATRLLGFLGNLPKSYRAEFQFGLSTSTQDAEGEPLQERLCSFTQLQLEAEVAALTGEIEQVPPMVSAVKVGGRPLYKAAREGEEVDRPSRKVMVYEFRVERFEPESYLAEVFVQCSSGTYVRTLASDLGERLGCGGHVASLRRTAIGSFGEADTVSLDTLEREDREARGLSLRAAMRDFPSVTVDETQSEDVSHGRPLLSTPTPARERELPVMSLSRPGGRPPHEAGMTSGVPVAILNSEGDLLAVYRKSRTGLKPEAVLTGR